MSKLATKVRRDKLISVCKKLKIQFKEFNSNSFRLESDEKIIDYYPKSNKCFWHSDHEWGEVVNIAKFLQFEFN